MFLLQQVPTYIKPLILVLSNIFKLYHMIEICSSAGFPKALGHLNKNSSCTIYYSHQPSVLLVISLLSHNYSMKPCTKARAGPIISSDNLNRKAIHTWLIASVSVCTVTFRHCKVFVLIFLRLIPEETN